MIKNISDLKRDDMFFLLAGPCVIEGEDMALRIAERVVKITDKLHIPYVFKGSYRKANRSRLDSFTGIGDEKALKILAKVRSTFDVPVVTDIHTASEAEMAAEYVDVLQIPAFLCRQTDLQEKICVFTMSMPLICWLRQLAPEELSILRKDSSCLLLPCVLLLIKS